MTTRTIAIFAVTATLLIPSFAPAQLRGKSKSPSARVNTGSRRQAVGPVTRHEAHAAINKLTAVTYRVIRVQAPPQPKPLPANGVASRSEILVLLNGIFEVARPKFKYTPNMIGFDSTLLTIAAGDRARPVSEKLISWGCVGRTDPLVTASKNGLSLEEFGDALGYFMSRIAELTHTPSTKYSPSLMGG